MSDRAACADEFDRRTFGHGWMAFANSMAIIWREKAMKKLEAIVQPEKVAGVKKALAGIGLKGLNVGRIEGFTRDTLRKRAVRSVEYDVDVVPDGRDHHRRGGRKRREGHR